LNEYYAGGSYVAAGTSGTYGAVPSSGTISIQNFYGTSAVTVPTAPTIGTATATGSTTATVSYTASSSNGGSTITSYTAISTPGSITGTLATSGSGTITVSGLSTGTSYTFKVYATNAVGNSPQSAASNSITTTANSYITYFSYNNSNGTQGAVSYDNVNDKVSVGLTLDLTLSPANRTFGRLNASTFALDYAVGSSGGSSYSPAQGVYNAAGGYTLFNWNPSTPYAIPVAAVTDASSPVQSWTKQYAISNSTYSLASPFYYGVGFDSSGNAYYAGGLYGTACYGCCGSYTTWASYVFKTNSSGTITWNIAFNYGQLGGGPDYSAVLGGIAVTSAGTIYTVGGLGDGYGYGLYLVKLNSSGTVTWDKRLMYSGSASAPYINRTANQCIGIDSSENIYIACTWFPYDIALNVTKVNSSGTLQWSRSLAYSGLGNANIYSGIKVDSSGNVYAWGSVAGTLFFAKWNTSGVLQFQRTWTVSGGSGAITAGLQEMAIANDGSILLGAKGTTTSTSSNPMYFKLPADGSKTGSYTVGGATYTYAAASGSEYALGVTASAGPGISSITSSTNFTTYSYSTYSFSNASTTQTTVTL
jgi:hypothetical protein